MPEYTSVWVRIKGTKPRRWKKGWKKVSYPTATHYSKHFTRAELECKCGCAVPALVEKELTILAKGLERIRKQLGPLSILSGYRCKTQNDKVGGARNSQHLLGTAADLLVPHGKQNQYVAAALRVKMFHDGGIGVYPNGGVHVDHRGYRARWTSFTR